MMECRFSFLDWLHFLFFALLCGLCFFVVCFCLFLCFLFCFCLGLVLVFYLAFCRGLRGWGNLKLENVISRKNNWLLEILSSENWYKQSREIKEKKPHRLRQDEGKKPLICHNLLYKESVSISFAQHSAIFDTALTVQRSSPPSVWNFTISNGLLHKLFCMSPYFKDFYNSPLILFSSSN